MDNVNTLILAGMSAIVCYTQYYQGLAVWWSIPLALLILSIKQNIPLINQHATPGATSIIWFLIWGACYYFGVTGTPAFQQAAFAFLLVQFAPGLYKTVAVGHKKNVGAGTIFIRDGKVLTVFRTNTAKNNNKHGLIGGRNETLETAKACAMREAFEEVGIILKPENLKLVHVIHSTEVANSLQEETIGFYFLAESWEGSPYNKAADKHAAIEWFDLNNLPSDMIPRNRQAIENWQKGIAYSEYGWKK